MCIEKIHVDIHGRFVLTGAPRQEELINEERVINLSCKYEIQPGRKRCPESGRAVTVIESFRQYCHTGVCKNLKINFPSPSRRYRYFRHSKAQNKHKEFGIRGGPISLLCQL